MRIFSNIFLLITLAASQNTPPNTVPFVIQVGQSGLSFDPKQATIAIGTTVLFTFGTDAPHNVFQSADAESCSRMIHLKKLLINVFC